MRDDLIGEWRAELKGVDLLYLEPVQDRFRLGIILRADGTASWEIGKPGSSDTSRESRAPFPITWDISPDRVLSIVIPIPPMTEYGLPDWTRNASRYDIVAISDVSLTLSNRRFDGEDVIVLRRMNHGEYGERQARQYLDKLAVVEDLTDRSRRGSSGESPRKDDV